MESLPDDVVRLVLGHCDQGTRVHMLGATRNLRGIASSCPDLWRSIIVHAPGMSALLFLRRVATACERMLVLSDRPCDSVWLIHGYLREVNPTALHTLRVQLCNAREDVPSNLLAACVAYRGLQKLEVAIQNDAHQFVEFAMPAQSAGFRTLKTLRCTETSTGEKGCTVTFSGAQAPALRNVHLEVFSSDFLDDARRSTFPSLRQVVYGSYDEGYWLTSLRNQRLRSMELDIHAGSDRTRLSAQLNKMVTVRTLVLRFTAPGPKLIFCVNEIVTAQNIVVFSTRARCTLHFEAGAPPQLESLTVRGSQTVEVVGAPGWFGRVRLDH